MGGRQSVQTDIQRRVRSNSAIESTTISDSHNRNESRAVRGISGSIAARGNILGGRISDSDEEPPGTSTAVNSTNISARPHAMRFSIPQLRAHRGLAFSHDFNSRRSMPLLQFLGRFSHDIKCPVCQKTVPSDDAEVHLVMCLTRPKITYNEDTLMEDKGECAICFDEMLSGSCIARLPCLCIYHKNCIDEWFTRKNCCPEHPGYD